METHGSNSRRNVHSKLRLSDCRSPAVDYQKPPAAAAGSAQIDPFSLMEVADATARI